MSEKSETLSPARFRRAIAVLTERHPLFARIVKEWGYPPFWKHTPGFAGLVLDILAQQVSIESADAAFQKLQRAISEVTPSAFVSLTDAQLKKIGFSRQKASYARGIAEAVVAGEFSFESLRKMSNDDARARLCEFRGIGKWTSDTYLLFSLKRADVWPSGDLALEKAVSDLRGLRTKLPTAKVDRMALAWRPHRAVAARLLWFHYLSQRSRI